MLRVVEFGLILNLFVGFDVFVVFFGGDWLNGVVFGMVY